MKIEIKPNETITELTKRYKKLLIQHHPDHGGTCEGFIELQESFKIAAAQASYTKIVYDDGIKKEVQEKLTPITLAKLNALLDCLFSKDIHIEVIGCWIWVTGATKESKEWFKDNGFRFAVKKSAWFYTEKPKVKYRSKKSIGELRIMWGTTGIRGGRKKEDDKKQIKAKTNQLSGVSF